MKPFKIIVYSKDPNCEPVIAGYNTTSVDADIFIFNADDDNIVVKLYDLIFRLQLVGTSIKYESDLKDDFWIGQNFRNCLINIEQYILRDPLFAILYARDVIHGRWPEAELVILDACKKPNLKRDVLYFHIYSYFVNIARERCQTEIEDYLRLHGGIYWGYYCDYWANKKIAI